MFMFIMIKPVVIVLSMLALLPLVLSEPPLWTPMFGQFCILLSLIYCFGHFLTGMTCPTFIHFASILPSKFLVPSFLSYVKIHGMDVFCGIAPVPSIITLPHGSDITAVLVWALSQCIDLFFGISIHITLFPFRPNLSRCRNCSIVYGPEEGPTVAKGEDTRSCDRNIPASAGQSPSTFCGSSCSGSSVADSWACTDSADAASSRSSADLIFDDTDSNPNSTWDSDATSATLLSDSDICSIAARFNHALVKKRFCVEHSIFSTPRSQLATEASIGDADFGDTNDLDSSCSQDHPFPLLGDFSTSFSLTSIVAQSPAPSKRSLVASPNRFYLDLSSSPTGVSHTLESVFRATVGSRSAPTSRRSSFSSNAPPFRSFSLFASSTSSDVSLAASSPSPSRPFSIFGPAILLPAGGPSSASSNSSLSNTFFEAPEAPAVDPSSLPSESDARFPRFTSLAYSPADSPAPASQIPASLSAWYLAEGRPVADGSTSRALHIFGIPVENLPACSYSVSSSSGDFSPKDEAYLRTALGLHEPTSEPRHGFCTAPGGPRRWYRGSEWHGWVFPGRGEQKPAFVPEEIPPQAPYDEDELTYLQTRWGFYPTPV